MDMIDCVTGESLSLPEYTLPVIASRPFQRLRYILQTGNVSSVFPGATHTRFQHSLGAASLAHRLLTGLAARQPELRLTSGDIATCVVAALCHDLGHGPYSHSFDAFMAHVYPRWSHEAQSVDMLYYVAEKNKRVKAALGAAGVNVNDACTMIQGDAMGELPPGRAFLAQIVSGPVDVDKLDYLQRDRHHTLGGHFFTAAEIEQLLLGARVVAGQLQWSPDCEPLLRHVRSARTYMHERVYQHPRVKVLDAMMVAALLRAKDRLLDGGGTLADACGDPEYYVTLTDLVINDALLGTGCIDNYIFRRIAKGRLWTIAHETEPEQADGIVAALGPELAQRVVLDTVRIKNESMTSWGIEDVAPPRAVMRVICMCDEDVETVKTLIKK